MQNLKLSQHERMTFSKLVCSFFSLPSPTPLPHSSLHTHLSPCFPASLPDFSLFLYLFFYALCLSDPSFGSRAMLYVSGCPWIFDPYTVSFYVLFIKKLFHKHVVNITFEIFWSDSMLVCILLKFEYSEPPIFNHRIDAYLKVFIAVFVGNHGNL